MIVDDEFTPDRVEEFVEACLSKNGTALAFLAAQAAEHPVATRLLALSLGRDRRATRAYRALPEHCPVRQAWRDARSPLVDELIRNHGSGAERQIRFRMHLTNDVDNEIQGFWLDCFQKGPELDWDSARSTIEGWLVVKARSWCVDRLRVLLRELRGGFNSVALESSAQEGAGTIFWRRLERLLLTGQVRPAPTLMLLLAEQKIAGPTELARSLMDRTFEQLWELLAANAEEPVPARTLQILRRVLRQIAPTGLRLSEFVGPSRRSPAEAMQGWVEEVREALERDLESRHWCELEQLASRIEERERRRLALVTQFLVDSLHAKADGWRLSIWVWERVLGASTGSYAHYTALEAAQEVEWRLRYLLPEVPVPEDLARRLAGVAPETPMGRVTSSLPARVVRSVEDDFREYLRRGGKENAFE